MSENIPVDGGGPALRSELTTARSSATGAAFGHFVYPTIPAITRSAAKTTIIATPMAYSRREAIVEPCAALDATGSVGVSKMARVFESVAGVLRPVLCATMLLPARLRIVR